MIQQLNDESCIYEEMGCTYTFACNFNVAAGSDDGSCVFAEPGYNCGELENAWEKVIALQI